MCIVKGREGKKNARFVGGTWKVKPWLGENTEGVPDASFGDCVECLREKPVCIWRELSRLRADTTASPFPLVVKTNKKDICANGTNSSVCGETCCVVQGGENCVTEFRRACAPTT